MKVSMVKYKFSIIIFFIFIPRNIQIKYSRTKYRECSKFMIISRLEFSPSFLNKIQSSRYINERLLVQRSILQFRIYLSRKIDVYFANSTINNTPNIPR